MDHRICNSLDLGGEKYYPEKETYFVLNLTDSVAAYQRVAHYRVIHHWKHYTLDLVGAKSDPEKETYFVADYQGEAHYRVMVHWINNTLDLGDAKYDPEKETYLFLISLTQSQPIKERHITESWTN